MRERAHDGRAHVGDVKRGLDGALALPPERHPTVEAVAKRPEVMVQERVIGTVHVRGPEHGGVGELFKDPLLALPLGLQPIGTLGEEGSLRKRTDTKRERVLKGTGII